MSTKPQLINTLPISESTVDSIDPASAHIGRIDPTLTHPSSQLECWLSAIVEMLNRIDRKLGRLLLPRDQRTNELVTIPQAAAMAGVSPTTIRRAIHLSDGSDKLIAYDQSLGRNRSTWRIDPADLDAWRKRRQGRKTEPSILMVRKSVTDAGQFKF